MNVYGTILTKNEWLVHALPYDWRRGVPYFEIWEEMPILEDVSEETRPNLQEKLWYIYADKSTTYTSTAGPYWQFSSTTSTTTKNNGI